MTSLLREEQQHSESPPPYPVRRWTLDEYHTLIEQGMFDEERVELLEGWIVPKMTRNPRRDATVVGVDGVLRPLLPPMTHLRSQLALTIGNSELEPDLAIVSGDLEDYELRHPRGQDVLLLVEVSDSSLRTDRRKMAIYTAGGVTNLWIIDLQNRQLEASTGPLSESGEYRNRRLYREGETVTLKLGEIESSISVERLFSRSKSEGT